MPSIFLIWPIGTLVLAAIGFGFFGFVSTRPGFTHQDSEDCMFVTIAVSLLWPLLVVISPFVGLYYFGRFVGKKRK